MIKITCGILILFLFNGCIQGTAFLGPAVTVASTGSVYQAGLSYASGKAIIKITGKTPTENVKFFFENNEIDDSENAKNFFEMVKKINKNSSVITLANQ